MNKNIIMLKKFYECIKFLLFNFNYLIKIIMTIKFFKFIILTI
jgi:hypothetical protein